MEQMESLTSIAVSWGRLFADPMEESKKQEMEDVAEIDARLGLVGVVKDALGVTGHADIVAHVWKLVATFDVPTKQDVFMIPEGEEQDVVSHCKLYYVQGFFDPVVLSINGRTIIYSSTELSCFQNSIFETHVWKNGILYSMLKSLPKGL